jgi:purine-binding chemotaxis protein CheW
MMGKTTLQQYFNENEWALLEARAKRVQQSIDDHNLKGEMLEVLRVFVRNENYALPVDNILAVYEDAAITPLPGTPAYIAGLTNLRGSIIPVLELCSLLNFEPEPLQAENVLVLLSHPQGQVAVRVDALDEVGSIAESDINPLTYDMKQTRSYVKGVLSNGTVLLDVHSILDDPSLVIDQS